MAGRAIVNGLHHGDDAAMVQFLKLVHVTCVVLSIGGLATRSALSFAGVKVPKSGWLGWAPHAVDSLLLAAAIGLMITTGQYPFVQTWLTVKVLAVTCYIILGSVLLDAGRSRASRLAAGLGALLLFGFIVSVAISRNPLGILG
jgi:uncharacterized membrane protein SirB2